MVNTISNIITFKRKNSFFAFSVLFYLATVAIADGTVFFYASAVLIIAAGLLDCLKGRKIVVFPLFFSMIAFIILNIILIASGNSLYPSASIKRLITFSLNILVNYFVFVFITKNYNGNLLLIGKWFIRFALLLIAYILVAGTSSVFSGRFGQDVPYLLGLSGTSDGVGFNSNFVCQIFFIAFSFSLLLFCYFRKRRYVFSSICFIAFSILTGSRTGILVLAIFSILFYLMLTKKLVKKFLIVLSSALIVIIGYFCLLKIPFLYENIGHRFEVLFNGLTQSGDYEIASSAYTRNDMIKFGLSMIADRPLIGYGLDSYAQLSPYGTYSHNNFIEILFSCGVIGFIFYYFGIIISILQLFKIQLKRISPIVALAFSLLVSSLLLNISHVDYVDRGSLFILFMSAAILFNQKKYLRTINR